MILPVLYNILEPDTGIDANLQKIVNAVVAQLTPLIEDVPSGVRSNLTTELTRVTELHRIQGLNSASPMTVTPTTRTAGSITLNLTGDGVTTTTVTRA